MKVAILGQNGGWHTESLRGALARGPEVDGEHWSSERLAKFLGDAGVHSVPAVAFLIGGSYGLPPEISRAAHVRLSLSAMTLPHRLARLVLAEQIYRGFTILNNEPYHH